MGTVILATFVYLMAVVGIVAILFFLLVLLMALNGQNFRLTIGSMKDKGNGKTP